MSEYDPESAPAPERASSPQRRQARRSMPGCIAVLVALVIVLGGGYFVVTKGVDAIKGQFSSAEDFGGPGRGRVTFQVHEGDSVTAIGQGLKAAGVVASNAADPSASAGNLAYHVPGAPGRLRYADGREVTLGGTHPALAGDRVAFLAGDLVVLADVDTLQTVATYPAPGADALALSATDVAWRAGDTLYAQPLAGGAPAAVYAGSGLGRPVLDGSRLVFARSTRRQSRIVAVDLTTGDRSTLRRARRALLLGPSLVDGRLMYVRSTPRRQKVVLGGRVISSTTPTARRDLGYEKERHPHHAGYPHGERPKAYPRPAAGLTVTLSTTAFDGDAAYVTRLRHRGGRTEASILRVR